MTDPDDEEFTVFFEDIGAPSHEDFPNLAYECPDYCECPLCLPPGNQVLLTYDHSKHRFTLVWDDDDPQWIWMSREALTGVIRSLNWTVGKEPFN